MRHETAIFDKKDKSRNSSYHFCIFVFEQSKTQKQIWNPDFYSVLAK